MDIMDNLGGQQQDGMS